MQHTAIIIHCTTHTKQPTTTQYKSKRKFNDELTKLSLVALENSLKDVNCFKFKMPVTLAVHTAYYVEEPKSPLKV